MMSKKKLISFLNLTFSLLVSATAFIACSSDSDDGSNTKNSYYYLRYNGETDYVRLGWDNSMEISYLKLEFEEGIPKGSEWYLTCDDSWVILRNTRGKVNLKSESVPITIEDNTDYKDREAHIYLEVDNAIPFSSSNTTVTIYQFGYEHYLSHGPGVSFDTDRSLAESSLLMLKFYSLDEMVEIDWGDGTKEVYNKKESFDAIGHQYSSTANTYRVKLRFSAWDSYGDASSFYFITGAEQGISNFYGKDDSFLYSYGNASSKKYVSFSEGNYSFK